MTTVKRTDMRTHKPTDMHGDMQHTHTHTLSVAVRGGWLDRLVNDCNLVELRRIHSTDRNQNRSALFDDAGALWEQATAWESPGCAIYTSLNRPTPDTDRRRPLTDAAISDYCRLLFDFDPEREKGQPSTDQQLRESIRMRDDFVQRMHALGWPEPALAMSGNGAHALYRVDLPATAETVEALKQLYMGLRDRLHGAGVVFDTTTRNPSRVCRLYGLRNLKTPGGRMATVEVPSDYRVVPERALRLAMDTYTPRKAHAPVKRLQPRLECDPRTVDVVRVFQDAGLYRHPMSDGKHSVVCPWAGDEHDVSSTSDTVIWERNRNGYPAFFCSHDHCRGRWLPHALNKLGVTL